MSADTKIQWTDKTFNGWWGCTKVGPGCDFCYADAFDKRTGGAHWGAGVLRRRTSAKNWSEPLRWNTEAARTGYRPWVFASSMCDVFDNEVPDEWRDDLWRLIRETPLLRWQMLTKRIGNVPKMLPSGWPDGFAHVGVMATIVNQDEADRDGPKLARVKSLGTSWVGISYEPALGPVDWSALLNFVDWIIVGGESGAKARPFHWEWAADTVAQCRVAGVPPFVKQMGYRPINKAGAPVRLKDAKGGDLNEWPAILRVREMPAISSPVIAAAVGGG